MTGIGGAFALAASLLAAIWTPQALTETYTVLHGFYGFPGDGAGPDAGLTQDSAGNLYGTTSGGGLGDVGTVFMVNSARQETILHSFSVVDGEYPLAGVVRDSAGNLYGTTNGGGTVGWGVVFKLDPAGTETVLHSFTAGEDGAMPSAGVILDPAGNLYGTTALGGASGLGVVFKVDTSGTETVLYSFSGADGGSPAAGLIRDSEGNLYGTTRAGGAFEWGVVFKLSTTGTETVLYSFTGEADGGGPVADLIVDSAGNFYSTTQYGGVASGISGYGVVFKLNASGMETVLHSFTGGADGGRPQAGLIRDSPGNLYGTANSGGALGYGVVFELHTTGAEAVLHSFTESRGGNPTGPLIGDAAGNLYGTAAGGNPTNDGVVFILRP